ncbi:MAG: heme ABC transporter ATP-binding protein [Thalassobaculaceae bacterium]|nr:heme ABC transporter ATP-binding protein [Thalassobaculaceae bacterium]
MSILLQARELTMRYGASEILSHVDFSLDVGEIVAVVGPNGAGKSTLIAGLSGERAISGGSVLLQGRPVASHSPRELALRRTVLPQSTSLLFHFTAYEVVQLGLHCARDAGAKIDGPELVNATLDRVGIAHLRDRFVPTLSGGERQRVHLARCLVQLRASPRLGPKLLILDEPTASLDPAHQHRVMEITRTFARSGNAVIAVVHDLNLAAAYADRLVVLSAGRIAYDGPVAEGLTPALLADLFHLDAEIIPHPRTGRPVVLQSGAI